MRGVANGNAEYALKMGVTVRTVRRAGGAEKLEELFLPIQRLLTKPWQGQQPKNTHRGMARLGMIPGIRGMVRIPKSMRPKAAK